MKLPDRYNTLTDHFKQIFGKQKVQKISLNAGFTCPNRDDTKGWGGCTYCLNKSFNPQYAQSRKSITQQLKEGVDFFSYKYPEMKYIAYFQAYTNTYAPFPELKAMYDEALAYPGIVGIAVSTRPDALDDETLDYLKKLSDKYYVALEIGIESTKNATLELINRGHTYEKTREAFYRAQYKNLHTVGHVILGLPKETKEDMLSHAKEISTLPLTGLKIHQLQVLKHTYMAKQLENYPDMFNFMNSLDEYVDLVVDFLEYINQHIVIERFVSQSPPELIIAPHWGEVKNFQVLNTVRKRLKQRNTYQGIKAVSY